MAPEQRSPDPNPLNPSSRGLGVDASPLAQDQRGPQPCTRALRRLLDHDLGFHGSDGRYATHGWHPFPAKFPPQLPQHFIESLTTPGDVVFDPMLGSGTTLVEAQRLGRQAIGCDIDPLARLMAAVKLTPLDPLAAIRAGRAVLRGARQDYVERRERLEESLAQRFDEPSRKFVDYWFLPERQLELTALLDRIDQLDEEPLRDFLRVVVSSTIIAKSGGVSMARDLAHTRPHRVLTKKPRSAFAEFQKKLENNVGGLRRSDDRPRATIHPRPAQRTGVRAASVDLIVTSPPYANNAIDYMRAHKFTLVWLGFRITDLTDLRKRYIGHDARGSERNHDLPASCRDTIEELALVDRRKAEALRRYFTEMGDVLAEMKRVLRPGKATVIVVASSVLRGIDVMTHENLAAIGQHLGFGLAGLGVRQLDRDKRMMPARWGRKPTSGIEKRMHDEYVIGLVKP